MVSDVKGWKTVAGAAVIGIGTAITALGMPEVGGAIANLGTALMGIGIGHKIMKAAGQ